MSLLRIRRCVDLVVLILLVCCTLSPAVGAQESSCAEEVEAYRLEAERQRLEAEKWRLEYERLALELAQCRTSLPDPERQANSSDLQEKALALALAACDLAWADALDSSDEFSCAEVSLIHVLEANNSQEGDAGLENLHDVAVTIMSAGDEDGTDGCEVSAVHTNSTVPATTLWTPRAR